MMRRCLAALAVCAVTACASSLERDEWLSSVAGNEAVLASTTPIEADHSRLVATNLVSVLAQLPSIRPSDTTVQVSMPGTAFGNAVVRALEEAGYGLQRVSADQGLNYVGYGRRVSETDAGPITDYRVAIGEIEVRREYVVDEDVLLPSTLIMVAGTEVPAAVVVDDAVFSERGGVDRRFVSGVRADSASGAGKIAEVEVRRERTLAPAERRTAAEVLDAARARGVASAATGRNGLRDGHVPLRRTVLLLAPGDVRRIGRANKLALRHLTRERLDDDVFIVTACLQQDGTDDEADARGVRVIEELLSLGVDASQIDLSPCRRTSFRHGSDASPQPVELVQTRRQ